MIVLLSKRRERSDRSAEEADQISTANCRIRKTFPRWRTWSRGRVSVLILLCLLSSYGVIAFAKDPDPALLRQLGDHDFRRRVEAERELLGLGIHGLELIEAGARSSDPEIRQRSLRLLGQLRKAAFLHQREQVRANPWVVPEEMAPGWELYHSFAGDHSEARDLYVRMVGEESELFQALAESPERCTIEVERRCADLRAFGDRRSNREVNPLTVLSLLLLANHPESKLNSFTVQTLTGLLVDGNFYQYVQSASDGEAMVCRGLLSAWVEHSGPVPASNRLDLAIRYELPAGITPAREIIANRRAAGASRNQLLSAIRFLAVFKPKDDLEDLDHLLIATEQELPNLVRGPILFEPPPAKPPVEGHEQFTSDLALLALIQITRQDPKTYRFAVQKLDLDRRFNSGAPIFPSSSDRARAMRLWKTWKSQHPSYFTPPSSDASEGWAG